MGPPGFFSRIRAYGTNKEIGRTTTTAQESQGQNQSHSHSRSQSTKRAFIDGPSLAHFLYESLRENERADEEPECFYRYTDLGEAAVKWLDNLRSFGFKIEGIYFDGALPAYKRQTRLDRLRKQTENLTNYKQRPRYAKSELLSTYDPTLAHCYTRMKRVDRALLKSARKNLPTHLPKPAFVVSAVIESLMVSDYSKEIWVVDGEADTFCAALACTVSTQYVLNNIKSYVTIFTNDSDLLIWNTGPATEIVIIKEMKERNTEGGKTMDALCFRPRAFEQCRKYEMSDLVKPAFKMLHSKMSFTQAVNEGSVDMSSDEFIRFSAQYHIAYAITKANHQYKQRENGGEVQISDPRVSEIVHHYQSAYSQNPGLDVRGTPSEAREKRKSVRFEPPTIEHNKHAWNEAQVAQEPTDPFDDVQNKTTESDSGANQSRPSLKLDMFLPALLEDPAKSAAWRIGVPFRNVAESLLMLPFDGHDTVVFEYKRSGQTVVPRQVQCASIEDLGESMVAYLTYLRNALAVAKQLDRRSQWKFVVMQLTLSDLHRDGKDQPRLEDIIKVVNGKASVYWSTVHLFARYQAEYYSLRMLKDIIDFCRDRAEFKRLNLPISLFEFAEKLNGLPEVGEFLSTEEAGVDEEVWQALAEEFVQKQQDIESM